MFHIKEWAGKGLGLLFLGYFAGYGLFFEHTMLNQLLQSSSWIFTPVIVLVITMGTIMSILVVGISIVRH